MSKILQSIAFWLILLATLLLYLALGIYGIFIILYAITPAPILVWTSIVGKDIYNAVVQVALIAFVLWWIRRELERQNWARAEAWFVAALVYPWQTFALRLVLKRTTGATKSIFWRTLWTLVWTSCLVALARVPLAVAAGLIDGSYLTQNWFPSITSLASGGVTMPIVLVGPNFIVSLVAEAIYRAKHVKVQAP